MTESGRVIWEKCDEYSITLRINLILKKVLQEGSIASKSKTNIHLSH